MFGECHAHIFMNGYDYKKAVADHINRPDEGLIRSYLQAYRDAEVFFVRDGGDRYGSSKLAKCISREYGIDYRTPIFAIHKNGTYGGIVGLGFDTMQEYHGLVLRAREEGADFIKIMTTGIMDFDHFGVITGEPLEKKDVREMIHIAHEEGMAVMAHTNGAVPVQIAVESGVDSIEHGNYIDYETIKMLADTDTVWVPTAVTIGNLLGDGRFPDIEVARILDAARQNIADAFSCGVHMGLGSDAGAYRVGHGTGIYDEYRLFLDVAGDQELVDQILTDSESIIREKFRSESAHEVCL